MKKIISFLIIPLLAFSTMLGCKKVEYSADSLSANYGTFMDSYIKGGQNLIFKNNIYATNSDNDEGDFVQDGEVFVPTYEKIMYITYDNAYNLNQTVNAMPTTKVQSQASQLNSVYQRLLSLIFNYYSNWSGNFYASIKDTDITQKEWEKLNDALHNLNLNTNTFLEKKEELENGVRMAGGVSGGLVEANLNTFNSHYNKLILSSLNYVNNFKDLHKKYIFKTNDITPSAAKRLVDEALLLLAESIFYDNVLAFEKSETTEIHEMQTTYSNSNYVWLTKPVWNGLVQKTTKGVYANSNTNARINEETDDVVGEMLINNGSDAEIKSQAIEKVEQLFLYVSSFDQNLKNYKQIFNKTNLNNYNSKRELVNISAGFDFSSLSAEEKSNITYLSNFSYDRIGTMFASLFQVMQANIII